MVESQLKAMFDPSLRFRLVQIAKVAILHADGDGFRPETSSFKKVRHPCHLQASAKSSILPHHLLGYRSEGALLRHVRRRTIADKNLFKA